MDGTDAESADHLQLPVPVTVAEALRLAVDRQRSGRLDDAERIYQAVLAVDPEQGDALHFTGVLAHQRGHPEEAVGWIERALQRIPNHPDAHNNLGNAHRDLGDPDAARACYERALALDPDHAGALSNLALTLKVVGGSIDEAAALLERAVALDANNPAFLLNLGNVYRYQRRFVEAAALFRRAVALQPGDGTAYRFLAYCLYVLGDRDEAVRLLRDWREVMPEHPVARHLLAAYGGEAVPDRASDGFVREAFRGFAASFDEVLAGLDYRAPDLVAAAVTAALGPPAGGLTVLDAGCGTGLCAPHLRPYAARLVGIDLSPEMLVRAARRGLYDELIETELTAYMASAPDRFDLIAAADTLCYLGRLDTALHAAAAALRPGGVCVFTLERSASDVLDPFTLHPHGRYSHLQSYVEGCLAVAGLSVRAIETVVLRKEMGSDVAGLLVTARRLA